MARHDDFKFIVDVAVFRICAYQCHAVFKRCDGFVFRLENHIAAVVDEAVFFVEQCAVFVAAACRHFIDVVVYLVDGVIFHLNDFFAIGVDKAEFSVFTYFGATVCKEVCRVVLVVDNDLSHVIDIAPFPLLVFVGD